MFDILDILSEGFSDLIYIKSAISLLTQLITIGTDVAKKGSSRALPSGKQIIIHVNYQHDMLLYLE